MNPEKRLLIVNPRGFCAGVERAIEVVERLLESEGTPLYVRKEIVHNKAVVEDFRRRGVVFVDELDEVPDGNMVVFSAHGIAPAVQHEADRRGLRSIDATCPLFTDQFALFSQLPWWDDAVAALPALGRPPLTLLEDRVVDGGPSPSPDPAPATANADPDAAPPPAP